MFMFNRNHGQLQVIDINTPCFVLLKNRLERGSVEVCILCLVLCPYWLKGIRPAGARVKKSLI